MLNESVRSSRLFLIVAREQTMSLDWKLTGIVDYKDFCWYQDSEGKDKLNPVTEVLIWSTLNIGYNEITEANYKDFAARLFLLDRVLGPYLEYNTPEGDRKVIRITEADVKRHIGLHTNGDRLAYTKFVKNLWDYAIRETKGETPEEYTAYSKWFKIKNAWDEHNKNPSNNPLITDENIGSIKPDDVEETSARAS